MQTVAKTSTEEQTGQLPEGHRFSQDSHHWEALQTLDLLDVFVLNHSELDFKEFFHRLQNLDGWHDLLAHLDTLRAPRTSLR